MRLTGVLAPVTTPFDSADEVDLSSLRANLGRYMATRLSGVVVLGSNGEAALLDDRESDLVIGAARDQVPRDRLLIAGTARQSTRGTIAATRRAAALGADAVLVRTPSYFKTRMTPDALAAHYEAVAEASIVPVILYNFTAVTGINLPRETVARLASHPNIAGIKDSNGDVAQVADLVALQGDQFQVLVGSAQTFFASLTHGASGGILALACVMPDDCVCLMDLVAAGRFDEALRIQRLLAPLTRCVTTEHGVPGLKAALDAAGYAGGPPRPPLLPVPAAVRMEIEAVYRRTLDGMV